MPFFELCRPGSFVDFFSCLNPYTDNMWGPGMLFAFFIIGMLALRSRGVDYLRAFATSSFLTMMLGMMFLALGWVGADIVLITVITTAGSVLLLIVKG